MQLRVVWETMTELGLGNSCKLRHDQICKHEIELTDDLKSLPQGYRDNQPLRFVYIPTTSSKG